MSYRSHRRPEAGDGGAQAQPADHAGAACRRNLASPKPVDCPSCGSPMHLWANYHRCRNCGYKESCCF
jgi:hypothetical protein